MSGFRDQLRPLRLWNRAAILAFLGALPVGGVLALGTEGTVLAPAAPIAGSVICAAVWLFGYIRIRTFRCR